MKRIVTSISITTDDPQTQERRNSEFFQKIGVESRIAKNDGIPTKSDLEADLAMALVIDIGNEKAALTNLSHKKPSVTINASFPEGTSVKHFSAVFDGVWCKLTTRPMNRLELLGHDSIK